MCILEANRAYFDLKMDGKLDNPDQRICEDVSSFVRNTVDIIALLSSKFLNVLGFTGVLWYASSHSLWSFLSLSCFLAVETKPLFSISLNHNAIEQIHIALPALSHKAPYYLRNIVVPMKHAFASGKSKQLPLL